MQENRQKKFYEILGLELTKVREASNMSLYDLARKVGEQWNTIRKMEAGGKFMAHQLVWLKSIGVDVDKCIEEATISLNKIPEIKGKKIVYEKKPSKYKHLLEESDEDEDEDESEDDFSNLF